MPLLFFVAAASCVTSVLAAFAARLWIDHPIPLVGSWIHLTLTMNPGIAFGVHMPSPWQEIVIAAALVGVLVVALRTDDRVSRAAYGLILGGALGNILDRLPDGFVTDYVAVGSFPVFNVADSCITIGVLLMLAQSIKMGRNARRNP